MWSLDLRQIKNLSTPNSILFLNTTEIFHYTFFIFFIAHYTLWYENIFIHTYMYVCLFYTFCAKSPQITILIMLKTTDCKEKLLFSENSFYCVYSDVIQHIFKTMILLKVNRRHIIIICLITGEWISRKLELIWKIKMETEIMAQRVRTLGVCPEDLCSVPRVHIPSHNCQ